MNDPDQDELVALRRRAYARDADIHLDPASLARLDELENAHRFLGDELSAPEVAVDAPAFVAEPTSEDPPPTPWWVAVADRVGPWAARVGRWMRGLRRSTVLVALGAVLIVGILVTALTLVQRVQTDPLQVGAVQVARLGIDDGYENPFPDSYSPTGSAEGIRGFEEFYGLRGVAGLQAFFYPYIDPSESDCIVIYVESTLVVQNGGLSGSLFSACAAGEFPPILQFPLGFPELPDELAAAYPDARGIQFVYDREDEEIVVFVDR